jgi:hypothetical protein
MVLERHEGREGRPRKRKAKKSDIPTLTSPSLETRMIILMKNDIAISPGSYRSIEQSNILVNPVM